MYNIKINTLSGKSCIFKNLKKDLTILEFKNVIYENHSFIDKPFKTGDLNKLLLELRYNGDILNDNIKLCNLNLDENDIFVFSIQSKSREIKKTLLNEYQVSPCSQDIFMDSFEFNNNSKEFNNNEIIKDIKNKIETIEREFKNIKILLNKI